MTAWRVGVAIKPEKTFGVEDTTADWHYVGIGMDMNHSAQNGWKFQNGMGSKTSQLEYEGRFTGNWSGNLYLDYNNFYWLLFGLESYAFYNDTSAKVGYHIFTTSNSKSVKSFSMRFIKLDREVGGPADEQIVLLGCVMDNVKPTYESNSSAIKCGVGGKFVNTKLTLANLDNTLGDTKGKNQPRPVNWGCLQVLNKEGTDWEKVANNERTGFTFSRSITTVPECGERIDTAYYESAISPISITAQVYSRNPNQWQTRMHTGGKRNDLVVGGTSQPRTKGLEGIPDIRIASGEDSKYALIAQFEGAVVDSWGNTYNSSSEIVETPTIKATKGIIIIKTPDVTTALAGVTAESVCKVEYNFSNTPAIPNLVMYYPTGYTIRLIEYSGTKSGQASTGWKTGSTTYKAGDEVTLTGTSMTFTAQWPTS